MRRWYSKDHPRKKKTIRKGEVSTFQKPTEDRQSVKAEDTMKAQSPEKRESLRGSPWGKKNGTSKKITGLLS